MLEEELSDKPGNHDWYEVFSITLYLNTIFWWDVVFDRWSTRMSVRVHRKAFLATILLAYPRGLLLSRKNPIFWHTVASSLVCTLPLAVKTVVGLLDVVTVSNSAEFKSFFADHVHRRSGVYNKFSFLWFNSWCRKAPIFRRWEEYCLKPFFLDLLARLFINLAVCTRALFPIMHPFSDL